MPKPVEAKVPVGLAAALERLGVRVADVLVAAELPADTLDAAVVRLAIGRYFALWRAIRGVSGDPAIGVRLAGQVRADHAEPLFLAMLSARDLAGAIDAVAAYKRMLSPEDVVIVRAGDEIGLRYAYPAALGEPPQALVDAEMAFVVEMARRSTGHGLLAPRRVMLRAGALEPGAPHRAYFACPVELGAQVNALCFAAADARRAFHTHNPQLVAALQPYLAANTPPAPASAIEPVRAAIAAQLRGQRPTVATVGKALAMSTRSLQRLLQDHRTSFRALLDEVRNDHARGYLRATAFSDLEIAYLLGFAEPTSFYRAFRAWNGVAPGEFRRQPDAIEAAGP